MSSAVGAKVVTVDQLNIHDFRALVVIGAPRSGTNLLRDILCNFPGYATWPCDEINPIWKHGNSGTDTDVLLPEHATSQVSRYIRGCFKRIARRYDASVVVEKTCANSLRVPFVDKVLPDARFIFISRDGYDAAASAMLRWTGSADLLYLLKKARFVPVTDLPKYGLRFLKARMRGRASVEGRLGSWGPVWPGMEQLLSEGRLEEICAAQWSECVRASVAGLETIESQRVYHISYEDLVSDPIKTLGGIKEFLGDKVTEQELRRAAVGIRADSLGKARARLASEKMRAMRPFIEEGERVLQKAGWLTQK